MLEQAQGNARAALQHLHLARQLWTSIDARLEAARLRIRIADCLFEIGDPNGAAAETAAALAIAEALGSGKLRRRCDMLRGRPGGKA